MWLDFIKFYFKATNAHGIHSPFVFDFYNLIFKKKSKSNLFEKIEKLRKEKLKDTSYISIEDFGAKSNINISTKRKISDIIRNSSFPPKRAQLLYNLINHYQYKNILELGTSLGFTTAYLSITDFIPKIATFEGCENTLNEAKKNHNLLDINNVTYHLGNIDLTLAVALIDINNLDFVLFDANHTYEATLRYFNLCLPKIHENTCFVIDDIYWSEGMKKAWKEIKKHPSVSISIDTFYFGIVFFKKTLQKQHFLLK